MALKPILIHPDPRLKKEAEKVRDVTDELLTLADDTDFLYKCTSPYSPETEQTLAWNDPSVGIEWPIDDLDPIISEKDAEAKALIDIRAFE